MCCLYGRDLDQLYGRVDAANNIAYCPGGTDGAACRTFVEKVLWSELRRDDVLILDNLAAHRDAAALAHAGVEVAPLPACSPDLHLTENIVGKTKTLVRKAAARTCETLVVALDAIASADCYNSRRHAGHGNKAPNVLQRSKRSARSPPHGGGVIHGSQACSVPVKRLAGNARGVGGDRVECPRIGGGGGTAAGRAATPGWRKVRAPSDTAMVNNHHPRGSGQRHRKDTAGGFRSAGKGEMVR